MIFLLSVTIVFLACILIFRWNLPYFVGKYGEKFVSKRLIELNIQQYKVLNDLLLPSVGNTNTTQIDHVVVSNFGIFCIETKNYRGWIFGNAYEQYWTQVIYRYKNKFYNPLRQNYAHIKAIESILKSSYPQIPIYGFVAFPSADKLQISGTDAVGRARDVINKIKLFNKFILTDVERDSIVQILTNANINDKEVRKLHNEATLALKNTNGF